MEFTLDELDGVAVVTACCELLDASNSERLRSFVSSALEETARIVVDLGELRFIDSCGFGALLACQQSAEEKGGGLKLCGVVDHVQALFRLVRLHEVFEMLDTKEEAIKACQA